MKSSERHKVFLVTASVILLFATTGFVWFQPHLLKTTPQTENALIDYWRERIQLVGPEKAYSEFVYSFEGKEEIQGHKSAHYFGAALYQEVGLKGVSVCDKRFQYGCSHELLGRAISERGLSALSEVQSICAASEKADPYSFCVHGIGHGISSYFGYDSTALSNAVSLCKKSFSYDTVDECLSGTVMEYLDRTMLGTDATPYPVSTYKPFAPCDQLEQSDKSFCIFMLPSVWRKNWWTGSAGTSTVAVETTGSYCQSLPSPLNKDCFSGIGNMVYLLSGGDVNKSIDLCSRYSKDPSLVASCIKQINYLTKAAG
ncbi:hypothetical protein KW798_02565 [Candidatus Parcubacteria bacterium]|nr:hypothetical protein [Candidatus Parcubacteria bacterium]